MGQACLICNHANRLQIDRDLVSGKSKSSIARQFSVSENSLYNHESAHLSRQLVQAMEKKQALEATNLLSGIEDLLNRTQRILSLAEQDKRYKLALDAIGQARGVYELLAKIAVSLHQARLAELELERRHAAQTEQTDVKAEFEKMEVLTMAEADLFVKLLFKMHNADRSLILIPDELEKFPTSNSQPDPAPDSEPESEPIEMVRGKSKPLGVGPIESEEIPSSRGTSLSRWSLGKRIYDGLSEH